MNENQPSKRLLISTVIGIVIVIIILVGFSWLLTRGVEDTDSTVPASTQQPSEIPSTTEPTNPNVDGGSTGTANPTGDSAPVVNPVQ